MVSVPPDDPRVPDIWRFRMEDLTRILDHLDLVEAAGPGLARMFHGSPGEGGGAGVAASGG